MLAMSLLLLFLPVAQAQWGPANNYGGRYKPGALCHALSVRTVRRMRSPEVRLRFSF
jgi:hypothetical protein